jgi:hypothetical protein
MKKILVILGLLGMIGCAKKGGYVGVATEHRGGDGMVLIWTKPDDKPMSCYFDNEPHSGDLVEMSREIAGYCHDSGIKYDPKMEGK